MNKTQTLSPVVRAALIATEEAAALDRDLQTTARMEFEVRSTRREIDEDALVEFEAEDVSSYGIAAPRIYRNEVAVPVRKSRRCGYSASSDFEAMAGFNLIHGIESSAQHGLYISAEMEVIQILKYNEEMDDIVLMREVVVDEENEEVDEAESQRQVIDGKVMYANPGVTIYRRGQFTCDNFDFSLRRKHSKKPTPQIQNQPKKKYSYACTECGSGFTCKSQLRTDADAAPIRCEACRKARPIHNHTKAVAQ